MEHYILGDPGAASRDKVIFSGESLLQELIILTEPVPEVVKFCPADWAEKYFFCPISKELQPGNSVAFLHEGLFFIDRPAWPVQRENCRGKFQEKKIQRS